MSFISTRQGVWHPLAVLSARAKSEVDRVIRRFPEGQVPAGRVTKNQALMDFQTISGDAFGSVRQRKGFSALKFLPGKGGMDPMIQRFDHVTVCVKDLDAAKHFFGLLGFEEDRPKAGIISGESFASYMGLDEVEASHTTLVVPGLVPRFEVRLSHCRHPEPQIDPNISRLDMVGFNHVCFAVIDAAATVEHLKSNGVAVSGDLKHFNDHSLYLVAGPEGITIELVQSAQAPRGKVGGRSRSKVLQQ